MEVTEITTNNEWVDFRHPEWQQLEQTWHFIENHYTGVALHIARERALSNLKRGTQPVTIDYSGYRDHNYLWRRIANESVEQFIERAFVSRYPRVMAAVVDQFSGSLMAVEQRDVRKYAKMWNGHPEDKNSELNAFWNNADGRGTNLLALIRKQIGKFTRLHRVWYLVENNRVSFPKIWDVVNWRFENNTLSEVLLKEGADNRSSIKERPSAKPVERYVLYTFLGWDRYEVRMNDRNERYIRHLPNESGVWDFLHYATPDQDPNNLILPIGFVELDVDGFPGRDMAEGANHLFNLLSDSRSILRSNNYPYWIGDVGDEQFKATIEARKKGWNMLQGNWRTDAPPAENAEMSYEVFRRETEEYFRDVHQQLNAATEQTATEVDVNDHRGRRPYLTTLAGSVEELENRIWFLWSQKQHADKPDQWLDTHVRRTRDFQPVNSTEWAKRLTERYFGKTVIVPTGSKGLLDVAQKILQLDGVNYDQAELETALTKFENELEATRKRGELENQRLEIVNDGEAEERRRLIAQRTTSIVGNPGE